MKTRRSLQLAFGGAAAVFAIAVSPALWAAPYASNVVISGTTVNFILNEPADTLTYSINGGGAIALDGTSNGAKSFALGAPGDTFTIIAEKNDPLGYTIPLDPPETVPGGGTRLGRETAKSGLNIISDDTNPLLRFYQPRGVGVNKNPNTVNFGTAYISNSSGGLNVESNRTTGVGMYAVRGDGSDAFGYGDTAQNPNVEGFPAFITSSSSSPYKTHVADDGTVYVTDWSDANGNLFQFAPNIATATNVFPDILNGGATSGDPPQLTNPGQNHGSVTAVYVEGSTAGGDLTVYTIDEDLTTFYLTGSGSDEDRSNLWKYEINNGALPSAVVPTVVSDVLLDAGVIADVSRGADGKWYLSQYRNQHAGTTSLYVLSPDGTTVLYDSQDDTVTNFNNGTTLDILQNVRGIAISPDQNWLALALLGSDVAVVPLVDGIPQLDDRLFVQTGNGSSFGGDVDFDAAGNIYYVSTATSQERMRVLAPGGHTITTLAYDGSEYSFDLETVAAPGEDNADFDDDGDVDGADFLTWQRNLETADAQRADGNANPGSGPGQDFVVDGYDLAVWESDHPSSAVAGAPVPEPATWAMAVAALLAAGAAARRRC
jgi:hypothetical protein